MSGFSGILGEPNGPPLLPPIAVTDEVTALVGAFATMLGLRHAEKSGEGQVIDVNLLESMFQIMGPLVSAYAHLGYLQPRLGSGIPYTVPRGTYRCADGVWVAVSSSADSVAERVISLVGLSNDPRFASFQGRTKHREEVEAHVRDWVAARSSEEVFREFRRVDAAIAPVYDMAQIFADPHYKARGMIAEVDGSEGEVATTAADAAEVMSAGALGDPLRLTGRRDARALWSWRDGVSIAVTAQRGGKLSEDIVVPVDRLADAIHGTLAIGARHGLPACSWGHAGDGNIHASFLIEPGHPDELERAERAAGETFALAIELGGSISGEHGIGVLKAPYLPMEQAPELIALQQKIKDVFDPKHILNPGKIFPADAKRFHGAC